MVVLEFIAGQLSQMTGKDEAEVRLTLGLATSIFASLIPRYCVGGSVFKRQIVSPLLSLYLSYFVYGMPGLIHPVAMVLYSWGLLRLTPSKKWAPVVVMVATMLHQTLGHYVRLRDQYLVYTYDWTMSTMLITLKVVTAAYWEHDHPQLPAIHFSSWVGYSLCLPGFLCGPFPVFPQYLKWAENCHTYPFKDVVVLSTRVWGRAVFVVANTLFLIWADFPEEAMSVPGWGSDMTSFSRWFYALMSMQVYWCRFYHVWLLGELACLVSGLSYNESTRTWDAAPQLHVLDWTLNTDPTGFTQHWHISIQTFLKNCVFKRVIPWCPHSTIAVALVYLFSSVWHGLYHGYFIFSFLMGINMGVLRKAKTRYAALLHLQVGADEKPSVGKRVGLAVYELLFLAYNNYNLVFMTLALRLLTFNRALVAWRNVTGFTPIYIMSAIWLSLYLLPKEHKKVAAAAGTPPPTLSPQTKRVSAE